MDSQARYYHEKAERLESELTSLRQQNEGYVQKIEELGEENARLKEEFKKSQ